MTLESHPHTNAGLRARFRHEKFDWLVLRLGWFSNRQVPPEAQLLSCRRNRRETLSRLREVTMTARSTFCPFKDLLVWLEAIALGCQECAFSWNCEGAEGRLSLKRANWIGGAAILTIEWTGRQKAPEFQYKIYCEPEQIVRVIYQALRGFVTSPEYRPLDYEQLRVGDRLSLRSGFTEPELIGQLLQMDVSAGEVYLQKIQPHGMMFVDGFDDDGLRFGAALAALASDENGTVPLRPLTLHRFGYLHPLWSRWDIRRKRTYLTTLFSHVIEAEGWFGTNLRALRSEIAEKYLGWSREGQIVKYQPAPSVDHPNWYVELTNTMAQNSQSGQEART